MVILKSILVSGNHVEQAHFERHFIELDSDALLELLADPIDRIKMDVALCCSHTDQAVCFASGTEGQSQTANQLQVLPRAIPTVKQLCFALNLLVANRVLQHRLKMVAL